MRALLALVLAASCIACSDSSGGGEPQDGATGADSGTGTDTATAADGAVDTTSPGDATGTDTARDDTTPTGDGATDTTVATDTTPPADGGAGLSSLSDDFGGTTLDPSWRLINPGLLKSYGVSSGVLSMEPKDGALWYNASSGAAIYKLVTGDFKVTTVAHARKASDGSATPSANYQLAGIIARDPASDGASAPENYVFTVVGYRVDTGGLVLETKNTVSDVSTDPHPGWASGDAELRICRRGSDYRLYKRTLGGGAWTLSNTYPRADLPATLQVGVITYAQSTADIRGSFDRVTFGNVASDADCTVDP